MHPPKNLFQLIRIFPVSFLAKELKNYNYDTRAVILFILEKFFVPMKKMDRWGWEVFFMRNKYMPFKNLISDCWHKEIKSKYPSIGLWNQDKIHILK